MYEQFFGFLERPFDLGPNPRFLVMTDSHREVLRNLEYGIASRKGVTLLVGEAGSGKTTLIRTAMQKLPQQVHCVHINNPTLTREEFVELLATRFGLSEAATRSKASFLIELEALLRHRYANGEMTVLIVDEAQRLPLELLEEIRLLANIETDQDKLLTVIIAGQPELAVRLNDPALRQLKQRIALRCELRALTLSEAAAYIAGRIRAAGGTGAHVFTRDAVTMIHRHASGIPRAMNVIADNALLGGFAAGQRPVGSTIVGEVCRDFDLSAGYPEAPSESGLRPPVQLLAGTSRSVSREVAPAAVPAGMTARGPASAVQTGTPEPASGQEPEAEQAAGSNMFGGFSAKRRRFSFFR